MFASAAAPFQAPRLPLQRPLCRHLRLRLPLRRRRLRRTRLRPRATWRASPLDLAPPLALQAAALGRPRRGTRPAPRPTSLPPPFKRPGAARPAPRPRSHRRLPPPRGASDGQRDEGHLDDRRRASARDDGSSARSRRETRRRRPASLPLVGRAGPSSNPTRATVASWNRRTASADLPTRTGDTRGTTAVTTSMARRDDSRRDDDRRDGR